MQRRRYWRPASILLVATLVLVTAAMVGSLSERAEAATVSISGTVYAADAASSLSITLYREVGDPGSGLWEWASSIDPMEAGTSYAYSFDDLAAGNYKVGFRNYAAGWLPEFYNNKRTLEDADIIAYDGTNMRTGMDCTFDPAPVCVSGTVRSADAENAILVTVYREVDGSLEWVDSKSADAAGPVWAYTFYGLAPGSYKVGFLTTPKDGSLSSITTSVRRMTSIIEYDGATPQTGID